MFARRRKKGERREKEERKKRERREKEERKKRERREKEERKKREKQPLSSTRTSVRDILRAENKAKAIC